MHPSASQTSVGDGDRFGGAAAVGAGVPTVRASSSVAIRLLAAIEHTPAYFDRAVRTGTRVQQRTLALADLQRTAQVGTDPQRSRAGGLILGNPLVRNEHAR